MAADCDVVIIGAGASGLAALAALDRAGRDAVCIEARNRIGGRIHTIRDPFLPVPIELGAEFIHGRPPEIEEIARAHGLRVYRCANDAVRVRAGKVRHGADEWGAVGRVMSDMAAAAADGPDQSFAQFLEGRTYPEEVKQAAEGFVEGFNAARKEIVSIASLAKDSEAADQIDGDSAFRFADGYEVLVRQILSGVGGGAERVRLNSVVERIAWARGRVTVDVRSSLTGERESIRAQSAIITVPLGVLQSVPGEEGNIVFDPDPGATLAAARTLQFGHVVRVVLHFREAVWADQEEFAEAGFIFGDEPNFPTWWSALPMQAPILTGWSAGPHADGLAGLTRQDVVRRAVEQLARTLGERVERLRALLAEAHFHDWSGDPFARGAYSYVPAGGLSARETLAEPVEGTLFFAGEATELQGHSATVHGAIASGRRAARQVLDGGS